MKESAPAGIIRSYCRQRYHQNGSGLTSHKAQSIPGSHPSAQVGGLHSWGPLTLALATWNLFPGFIFQNREEAQLFRVCSASWFQPVAEANAHATAPMGPFFHGWPRRRKACRARTPPCFVATGVAYSSSAATKSRRIIRASPVSFLQASGAEYDVSPALARFPEAATTRPVTQAHWGRLPP